MTVRFVTAAACAIALSGVALPAAAACQLKAFPIPVVMRGLRPIVTAKVNGQDAHFVLDSGSTINALNGKLAATLKLKPLGIAETGTHMNVAASVDINGVSGKDTLNGVVKADTFDFNGMAFKDVPFMATDRIGADDGLIGQAFLHSVDVEYDLAGGVVRRAKPQGCGGVNMAYWAKDGAAYSVMPLEWIDKDRPHTEAAIYVNGVRLRAALDTGASTSLISESAAARAGVNTGDAGVVPIGEGQGLDAAFKTWVGTFASIKIGDEEIKNTPMMIGRSNAGFDVLLGADFFLSHHIYVANSQEKIYFTYSGGPVFRTPRQRPAPTTTQK